MQRSNRKTGTKGNSENMSSGPAKKQNWGVWGAGGQASWPRMGQDMNHASGLIKLTANKQLSLKHKKNKQQRKIFNTTKQIAPGFKYQ